MTPLRFAVIGDPIEHSRSPAMHMAALAALGLPHVYEAVRVTEAELPGVVQALRGGAFAGLNVTLPHKTRVLALTDEIHDTARAVGAANTLVRVAGRVVAHNTDAPALAAELTELAGGGPVGSWSRALVLGAGGAARAAVAALDGLGVRDVVVRARSSGSTFELRQGVPRFAPWSADATSERGTSVVVQATSAGMAGADPGDSVADIVAWGALPPDAVALDVVYAPAVTPFLEAAKRHGLRAAGGLGMLARQGALAFELFLGRPAPLGVMRAVLG